MGAASARRTRAAYVPCSSESSSTYTIREGWALAMGVAAARWTRAAYVPSSSESSTYTTREGWALEVNGERSGLSVDEEASTSRARTSARVSGCFWRLTEYFGSISQLLSGRFWWLTSCSGVGEAGKKRGEYGDSNALLTFTDALGVLAGKFGRLFFCAGPLIGIWGSKAHWIMTEPLTKHSA